MREISIWAVVMAIVFGVILAIGAAIGFIPERLAVDEVNGTVTDKYIKRSGESDYFHVAVKYADGTTEVFQNKDSLWWWKWNSADVQQELEIGKSYHFTVTGWRVPFLSWFRNIVVAEPAADQ